MKITCYDDCRYYKICTLRKMIKGLNAENCASYEEEECIYFE